ncbi:antidote-toxin recognition MazE [Leptospira wolbachii serovar Codice str. CDC]|uniref:Antidote-toxin recognition MazE n=1 Tax=Leptospira wolbachii serovar Codice str. CDC TaxID=1218599 RepID=R9A3I4_9LEPT|nr:AbrB/MazE/SpoVT family DNA-binding domain-containing protein [Leptospira wolbachii]EOQ96763.1 antidote-toxin recognition MazE [Leptospira wolbachii serovar Codice str. CDC]
MRKLFAKQLDLNDGSQVELIQEGNRIIISPYINETLDQKLKKITEKTSIMKLILDLPLVMSFGK